MVLCLALWSVARAQEPDSPLTLDETRTISLDGAQPSHLTFEAAGTEVVTITAHTLEPDTGEREARNVVLAVLDPHNEQIAYNDNHFGGDEALLPTDAMIEKLELHEAGIYTIRVDTYGGIFPGQVEVRLAAADMFETQFHEDDGLLVIGGVLPQNRRYRYTFEAAAGEALTATLRDTSGTLDPVLWLVAADGETVAFNDDHGTGDSTLDVFDARLRDVALMASGHYTLIVTDFTGQAGAFELVIARGETSVMDN